MKKYSVRYVCRTPDRVSSRVITFKALSVADALVRFERYGRSEMTDKDVDVEAVWQCSSCECRARRSEGGMK